MRKLLLYILLLASFASSAQVDYFTLTRDNGELMGMVEHRAPVNPNGKLDPVILWLHGVDANVNAQPANANDTLRIAVVTNKGPLRLVRGGTPLPLFQKPGTVGAEHRYRWNIVAPQNPQPQSPGDSIPWRTDVVDKAMAYIRANPSKWDTSLIVIVGYSLGGRAVKTCLERTAILPYVKYAVDIAGGTISGTTLMFQKYAASGIPIDFFFTVSDELVNETQLDNFVNGIKAQNPQVVPNYIRLTDIIQTSTTTNPEHDFMEVLIARDTTTGDTETTTNGDTWTNLETIFQRGLRFFGPRRQRALWIIPILFIPRRRKSSIKKAA